MRAILPFLHMNRLNTMVIDTTFSDLMQCFGYNLDGPIKMSSNI